MARKQDKDQATQVVLNLVREAEEMKKQEAQLKIVAKNPFQPPPELVEVDAQINQEKINEEIGQNEIEISLTGSPQLAALDASYIKYYLTYEEGKTLEGHFDIKHENNTKKYTFQTPNLAKVLHSLKEKKIDFTLKKKKFFGQDLLETQSLNLTTFGAHSILHKHVEIQGARFTVKMTIHKSTRTKEFEKVAGTKLTVGPIPTPFKTLEEIEAAKTATVAPARQPGAAQPQAQRQQARP